SAANNPEPWSPGNEVTAKLVGLPSSAYHAQAARGGANGQVKIRAVPRGVSGLGPISIASQLHGPRDSQSGRSVPGSTGVQIGALSGRYVAVYPCRSSNRESCATNRALEYGNIRVRCAWAVQS